jgi:uncharacterized protein YjbJ (UPF0337 family)
MNKDIFKGQWNEVKGKVKEQWGKLTDDDLTKINGRREQLVGLLQKRYGYAKEQAEKDIKDFESQSEFFDVDEGNFEEVEDFNKRKTGTDNY